MGSRSDIDLAYIAGFLDGDGSLMLQLKKRKDTKRGFRIMATVCFYQDSRHEQSLYWIREVLNSGYISRRKDGMTELRINGNNTVKAILNELKPYIRFKKVQTIAMVKALIILESDINLLSSKDLKDIVANILIIQNENYKSHKKRSVEDFYKILDLTP